MLVLLTALFLTAPSDAVKLTAELLVTNQPGTVVLRWRQGQPLTLQNVKTARRGEPMAAFVLFTNCRPDKQGKCDVRAEMTVMDPLQKVYGESKDTEVWVGKPAPAGGSSQLGVGYMMVVIEPGDPPGQYRVKAHVTDRVAGTALDPEWSFEVPPLRAEDSGLAPRLQADDRIQLHVDTSEADAVLSLLARRTAGAPITDVDWQRVFDSEPYRRLKQRETEMKRSFEDADFKAFVMSEALLPRAAELGETVAAWKGIDLEASARSVLDYLPAQARIYAKVFPVIKPKTNSFVFDVKNDPTIFLYVDPAVSAEQFANTVRHELHHIGLGSVSSASEAALKDLPPPAKAAAEWMGGFGEGMAMLAAAGGPDVNPHAASSAEDRARWDRDVANFSRELRTVERFFLDVIDGRLKGEDAIREKAFAFYGVQGPWYTVGWKMAAVVEKTYGRQVLIEAMLDPRRLLAAYNRAIESGKTGERLPSWSPRLLRAVRAPRPS